MQVAFVKGVRCQLHDFLGCLNIQIKATGKCDDRFDAWACACTINCSAVEYLVKACKATEMRRAYTALCNDLSHKLPCGLLRIGEAVRICFVFQIHHVSFGALQREQSLLDFL